MIWEIFFLTTKVLIVAINKIFLSCYDKNCFNSESKKPIFSVIIRMC